MNFLVLGASGGVGTELVRQSVDRGHGVTAFVRSANTLAPFANRINVVVGDPLKEAELRPALEGQDAVLSAFGPRPPIPAEDHDLLARFADTLTRSMSSSACRRCVVVSTAFLFRDALLPPAYLVGRLFFSSVVTDAAAMERIIRGSALDWTLVRPPQLTDKPCTGAYRQRESHLPLFGFTISRANTAHCMINVAENHLHSRKILGISA